MSAEIQHSVTIPLATAQVVFDALVHSMDFGSGFLDTEEVDALRGLAVALGVDPATATPTEFVKQYPHAFKPMTDPRTIERVFGLVKNEWQDRSALGLPPGFVLVREDGKPEIDFVPCLAGGYPYCQKPETDPIHSEQAMAAALAIAERDRSDPSGGDVR